MKRMIDNKEFENIKNDISELQEEIKSIEGIPTITISLSQMLNEDNAQLTDEQFNILNSNTFVNIVLPNLHVVGFVKSFRGGNQEIYFYATYDSGADLDHDNQLYVNIFEVRIAINTKIATLNINKIYSCEGKQLYQHNLVIFTAGSYGYTLTFLTEDNTKITGSTWATYWANHPNLVNKYLHCSGFSSNKIISAFKIILDEGYYKQSIYTDSATPTNWGWSSSALVEDEVIPL